MRHDQHDTSMEPLNAMINMTRQGKGVAGGQRGRGGQKDGNGLHGALYDDSQMHYYERRDNGSHMLLQQQNTHSNFSTG